MSACIYLKISGSKFIFLVLFVLLASSDVYLLNETNGFVLRHLIYMKDMDEASYVVVIEMVRDRSRCMLGLSQKIYVSKTLQRFDMHI